jgi:hypothetical protein
MAQSQKSCNPALVPKKDAEVPKGSDSGLTVLEANQPAAPSTDSSRTSAAAGTLCSTQLEDLLHELLLVVTVLRKAKLKHRKVQLCVLYM